jgi:hypothetical protein
VLIALSHSNEIKVKQVCDAVDPYQSLIMPSYVCYNWTQLDVDECNKEFGCSLGQGDVNCETEYCNSLTNLNAGIQFYFAHGDGTCGNCWCCVVLDQALQLILL